MTFYLLRMLLSFIILFSSFHFDSTGNLFDDYYDKPWCRVGPYVVGVLAGYILYRTNCKLQIPKVFVLESLPFNATAAIIKDKAASYVSFVNGLIKRCNKPESDTLVF